MKFCTFKKSQGQSDRWVINDTDGGQDWIQCASMTSELNLFLTAGMTSFAAKYGFMIISPVTLIRNAAGGEANDKIQGDAADILIYGMCGKDQLWGDDGLDTAGFLGHSSNYSITYEGGRTTVAGVDEVGVLQGFEQLRFQDKDIVDPSFVKIIYDTIGPIVSLSTTEDNSTCVDIETNVALIFIKKIQKGNSFIKLYNSNGILIEQFDQDQMAVSEIHVTHNLPQNLGYNTSCYLLIDRDKILDGADNLYSGIGDSSVLNFTTVSDFNSVKGSMKSDKLNGTSGKDLIQGFADNDVINYKLGMNTLFGGSGKDVFVFDTGLSDMNVDTISDFVTADDTIKIDYAIYTKIKSTGSLNAGLFRSTV